MEAEFEIKVTTGDMYRFLMYHTYHTFNGLFSILAGVVLIVFFVVRKDSVSNPWVYLIFGILFLVYFPWTLLNRAAQQVKLAPTFKKPLQYILTAEQLEVRQEKESVQVRWDQIYKIKETGSNILVYTNKKNAFIWVKKQLGNQHAAVRDILKQQVEADRLSLKE